MRPERAKAAQRCRVARVGISMRPERSVDRPYSHAAHLSQIEKFPVGYEINLWHPLLAGRKMFPSPRGPTASYR